MARQNCINRATGSLTVDPGAAGDSFVQFAINTTDEFRIGVDDTDDSFRISQGNALGANDTFVMSAAGECTMPLQVAFAAYLATTDANVTGNGTSFTLGTGNALTEIFDQNGDFNTNGTFTAPVTGRYALSASFLIQQAAAATGGGVSFLTSNRGWSVWQLDPTNCNVGGELGCNATIFADMDAADTAVTRVNYNGIGADTADVYGGATDPKSSFSGYLAC